MRLFALLRLVPLFIALSTAEPEPKALAEPEPKALAEPEPDPDPESQQYTNNAPFSGAIYIVNPNGQQITAQDANMCPSYASVSCSNINQPSWCCPNSYTCASGSNGLVGCCPSGSSCGGSVNVAAATTVTVQAVQQTSYVYVQPEPTTVAVYNAPTQQVTQQVAQGGFCATLTMDGPGLPTTKQGDCGTILIVNEAMPSLKAIGYSLSAIIVLLHFAIGRMFHRI